MVFQWFSMVANHWSDDGMVTIHRSGLDGYDGDDDDDDADEDSDDTCVSRSGQQPRHWS